MFVGKKQAYPLRHLRAVKTVTKYLVARYQRLSFAHGEVNVYPYLANHDVFKKSLENNWEEVQKKYQGKNYSEEEALILSPEEEAIKIGVPPIRKITQQQPEQTNEKNNAEVKQAENAEQMDTESNE